MRSPRLKYLGIILAIIGFLITVGGLFLGSMPYFHSSISEYSLEIITGIIILVVGLLMWIFISE
jgi:hypothetical protein